MVIQQQQAGFTLAELMIVVAISAILTSLAAPSFRELIVNTRLQAATSDMQAGLLLARSEAVKRNAQVRFLPLTGGWNKGWQVVDPNDVVLATIGGESNLAISANMAALQYLPSGRISGVTAPEFEISDPREVGKTRCLRSDRSGRPYVQVEPC
ncbi:MAG: GspH/FimT family pseudopilin [Oceanococcus sp.]